MNTIKLNELNGLDLNATDSETLIKIEKITYSGCTFTVGELRRELELWDNDSELLITLDGRACLFNRTKGRGENLVCIELNDPIESSKDGARWI